MDLLQQKLRVICASEHYEKNHCQSFVDVSMVTVGKITIFTRNVKRPAFFRLCHQTEFVVEFYLCNITLEDLLLYFYAEAQQTPFKYLTVIRDNKL